MTIRSRAMAAAIVAILTLGLASCSDREEITGCSDALALAAVARPVPPRPAAPKRPANPKPRPTLPKPHGGGVHVEIDLDDCDD